VYVALAWGFIAAASLIIGGLLALHLTISRRTLGYIMAFGGGVLISAIAYELVEEAVATAAGGPVALGVFAGAITFFGGDLLIDRLGGSGRKASSGEQAEGNTLPIVLGTVLDGIPESIVLGVTLLDGGISVAMLSAIFISNVPEAIAGTTGLQAAGWRRGQILALWTTVAVVSGLSCAVGYQVLDTADPGTIAFIQAFAAGALLTMLADTMMPEAFEHGGKSVGLWTTLGFCVAFALTQLE
jgi:zinc transporter, ZIP family